MPDRDTNREALQYVEKATDSETIRIDENLPTSSKFASSKEFDLTWMKRSSRRRRPRKN